MKTNVEIINPIDYYSDVAYYSRFPAVRSPETLTTLTRHDWGLSGVSASNCRPPSAARCSSSVFFARDASRGKEIAPQIVHHDKQPNINPEDMQMVTYDRFYNRFQHHPVAPRDVQPVANPEDMQMVVYCG